MWTVQDVVAVGVDSLLADGTSALECDGDLSAGRRRFDAAYREAEAHPITLLPPIPEALGWKFAQVMSTAYHLQRFQGSEPILLPIKALAQLLGCHHTTLSAITSLGVRYKLLLPVDPNYSYERHQAKRYQFNLTSPHYRPPAEGRP